jgi:hypothetical protein
VRRLERLRQELPKVAKADNADPHSLARQDRNLALLQRLELRTEC